MPLSGIIAALTTVTLWGLNFVAVKIAVTEVPAVFVAAMRFGILTILLLPFLKVPKLQFRPLIVYALIMGIGHFTILFVAIQHFDVSTAGIVLQLGTPFVVLLAWLMLGEQFGIWRAAGMGMAFSGVVVLIGAPGADVDLVWMAVLILVAFFWALGNIHAKRMPAIAPFTLIAWMSAVVTPILFGLSMIFETGQVAAIQAASLSFWLSMTYIVVCSSIIGYGLWYWLIKRYDITAAAPFNLLVPLVAVIAGTLMLGDQMSVSKIIGGVLILGGVCLITVRQVILSRRARITAPATGVAP